MLSAHLSEANTSIAARINPWNLPCANVLRIGCILVAALIPLKLILAYAVLIPLILLWLVSSSWRFGLISGSPLERSITVPLAFLILTTCLSAITGIDPLHSISPLLSLIFFALTIFVFRDYGDSYGVPLALISAQALASLHTVIAATFPGFIPQLFLGSVTESGQLAISVLVCIGVLLKKFIASGKQISPAVPRTAILCCVVAVATMTSIGFRDAIPSNIFSITTLCCAALTIFAYLIARSQKLRGTARGLLTLSSLHLPLLISALLLNLKRGPWFGVLVGIGVLCTLFAKRWIMIIGASTVMIAVAVTPIRERLAVSYEHFTISGGRSTIWRIGGELIEHYPLGIGYHNSGIMRKFSLEIPPELKHFHNNLINIAAESGVLTAMIFCWLIYSIVRVCLRQPHNIMHVAIGCAIISWQTAGLVEYNFGDSEVMIIVWLLIGLVLGDIRKESPT